MENNPTYLFVVAAALQDQAGRILVQKRPKGKPMEGLWEFPGGKVEQREGPEAALCRELQEELDIEVAEEDLAPIAFASEPLGSKHLILLLYICTKWTGSPREVESDELQWLLPSALKDLQMPPADYPLVDQLISSST